ncbi:MAG: hypothetical protein RLY31_3084 [Bacteroidota bacterium]|jgi:outer membrane protein assembly factor BamA
MLAVLPVFIAATLAAMQPPKNGPSPDTLADILNPTPYTSVTIRDVHIRGNKRTKNAVILREIDFSIGDTIPLEQLADRLSQNRNNLLNTGLFLSADISFREWQGATGRIALEISVVESWYIYPYPILELADRNFNVWWETYARSLRRLNMGVRFYHQNLSGRRDQLKLLVQYGFTRKREVIYTLPFFNRHRTLGMNINFLHTQEKEIGYNTRNNELLFRRDNDKVLLKRLRVGAGLLFRPQLHYFHRWDLTWHDNLIDRSIQDTWNPNFFLAGLRQRYLAFQYHFTIDKRDVRPYPMRGYRFATSLHVMGFGQTHDLRSRYLSAEHQRYRRLSDRTSIGLDLKARVALARQQQPYYNSTALGYFLDFIRGYELYVIDGLDYAFAKTNLRIRLAESLVQPPRWFRSDRIRNIPMKLFLSLHHETAYVNNPHYGETNGLANSLLTGITLGCDLILHYDRVFHFEFSRNHLNEYGFFLHWATRF